MRISVILFFLTFNVPAQSFYPAFIQFNDGTEQSGFASIPSNKSDKGKIYFKSSLVEESTAISSEDVSTLYIRLENGEQYVFEYIGINKISKKYHEKKEKQCSKSSKNWVLLTSQGKLINTYYISTSYEVNYQGALVCVSNDDSGIWEDIYIVLKKSNENCGAFLGQLSLAQSFSQEKNFVKNASIYFRDYNKIVQKINDKAYKSNETEALVDLFHQLYN